jgi:hypothetical protein
MICTASVMLYPTSFFFFLQIPLWLFRCKLLFQSIVSYSAMPNFSPNMEMNVRRYVMHRYTSACKSPVGPCTE